MKTGNRSIFSIILPISLLFFLSIFSQQCTTNENTELQDLDKLESKHKGVHLFGHLDSTNLQPFVQNNFDWISLVPFGDQKDFDSPMMNFRRGDSLRMVRRDSAWSSQIDLAHANGFNVFLKPHIWIYEPTSGKWRSDIFPNHDDDWETWKKSYREFIIYYAKMAEKNKVELFCIGTELSRLSVEKSEYWKKLIQEVRTIYSGKITYAANWYNEFEKITFWEDLDFIGIQAYFPLSNNTYPSTEEISKGWKKHIPSIVTTAKKYNRKILFTEMGYKSTPNSAIEPWQWVDYSTEEDKPISVETQANCYQAFFDTFWEKNWFAGVHIWQMRSDFVKSRGWSDLDFTPQGKPAEKIISKAFE